MILKSLHQTQLLDLIYFFRINIKVFIGLIKIRIDNGEGSILDNKLLKN